MASQLCQEKNDICVVDRDKERITRVTGMYDVMGICGNGSNYTTLLEAGIGDADLLIAVTESDELNLLCCVIAQKAGECKAIARVRNPVYEGETDFLQKELGLSMIINPELLAATEMFHVLCFPNASEISFFAKGQAEIIRYRIPDGSVLNDMKLKDISARINDNLLIVAVERENQVIIPTGDFILHSGDMISIIASRKTAIDLFHAIKASTNPVQNTMIIGGGKIAVYLARMLIKSGIGVKIIESNMARCEELSDMLPHATIIHGDGSDRELLKEERIGSMDSFVALTNFDEENILLSLFAQKLVKKKVVTKINRFQLNEVIYNLNLDSAVFPKNLTTERIIQYVRATQNSIGSNIQTLYRLYEDKVEALEFRITENSALINKPLCELNIKKGVIIGCITRNGQSIIPNGQDQILPGDSVIIVTSRLGLRDAKDILAH